MLSIIPLQMAAEYRIAKNRRPLATVPRRWVLTAEAIGIPYRRLRGAVSRGLGRPDQRNADHPQSLTTFFGLRRIDDLWRPSLVELGLTARRGFTPCFFFEFLQPFLQAQSLLGMPHQCIRARRLFGF